VNSEVMADVGDPY